MKENLFSSWVAFSLVLPALAEADFDSNMDTARQIPVLEEPEFLIVTIGRPESRRTKMKKKGQGNGSNDLDSETNPVWAPLEPEGELIPVGKGKRPYKDVQKKKAKKKKPYIMMPEDYSEVARWDLSDSSLFGDPTYATDFNTIVEHAFKASCEENVGASPFLICNRAKDDYGIVRKTNICDMIGANDDICNRISINENTQDETCLTCSATCEVMQYAAGACGDDCIILPLAPPLKLVEGITDLVQNENVTKFHIGLIERPPDVLSGLPDNNTSSSANTVPVSGSIEETSVPVQVIDSVLSTLLGEVDFDSETEHESVGILSRRKRMLKPDHYFFGPSKKREEEAKHRRLRRSSNDLEDSNDSDEPSELFSRSHYSRKLKVLRRAQAYTPNAEDPCVPLFLQLKMETYENDPNSMTVELIGGDQLGMDQQTIQDCVLKAIMAFASSSDVSIISPMPNLSLYASNPETIGQNEMQWIVQSDIPQSRPFFQAGITGEGQVVGMSDTGLDTDNCYFLGNTYIDKNCGNGSGNQNHRKVLKYCPRSDDKDGEGGHGTAVASILAGKRQGARGFADGMAPDAKLVVFDISDDSNPQQHKCCNLPGQFSVFLDHARTAGAKIHNVSWGSTYCGYIAYDRMFDQYMYERPDQLIIVAAGNIKQGQSYVGSPGIAKNVITVGASYSAGNDLESGEAGRNYLWHGSCTGPTCGEGRVKPDIVAPGKSLLAARSKPSSYGECDPAQKIQPGQEADGNSYRYGTSFAAPVVSGAAALIRQYFMDGFYPSGSGPNGSRSYNPSAALVKAILLNGAQPLMGKQLENGSIVNMNSLDRGYDAQQGFGRISLMDSLPLYTNSIKIKAIFYDRIPISAGEVHQSIVSIDTSNCNSNNGLSVTLAWNDPESATGCVSCMLSNLNLVVQRQNDGTMWRGNDIWNQGVFDSTNNVERVRINSVNQNHTFIIRVVAVNLAFAQQRYSLAIAGCPKYEWSSANFNACPCPLGQFCTGCDNYLAS